MTNRVKQRAPAGLLSTHDVQRLSGLSYDRFRHLIERRAIPLPPSRRGELRKFTVDEAVTLIVALHSHELGLAPKGWRVSADDPKTWTRRLGAATYKVDLEAIRFACLAEVMRFATRAPR